MNAEIIMSLESDAIPGSGNSLAGIVDRDVNFDAHGVPFVPAKRLKGVMREAADELAEYGALQGNPDDIFGREGAEKASGFILTDGFLPDAAAFRELSQWAGDDKKASPLFSPHAVIEHFTYTRSQTAIEPEKGIAKRNSLRISRVIRKGLKFHFGLQCPDTHRDDMEKICKAVRAFGIARTRGFGQIRLRLAPMEVIEATASHEPISCASGCLRLRVENEGALLVGSRPGQIQATESFIPGAMVLAAFASEYLKNGGSGDDRDFHELFLSGKVRFGNLHPWLPEQDSFPFQPAPLSLRKVKSDPQGLADAEYYDHMLMDPDDDADLLEDVVFKGGAGECVAFEDETFRSLSPLRAISAHHQRPPNRAIAHAVENEGKFFQFEVLEPNQAFTGIIVGESDLLKCLMKHMPKDGVMHFGKSKTAQYGKCRIQIEEETWNPASGTWSNNDSLNVMLLSDTILLNENGFPSPMLDQLRQDFAARLGIEKDELIIEKSFAAAVETGGFLGIWRMPRLQMPALAAGTVARFKNVSGKVLDIGDALSRPFGIRTEDGYGRIVLYGNEEKELEQVPIFSGHKKSFPDLPAGTEVEAFVKTVIESKIRSHLIARAREKAAKSEQVNNHFIGRVTALLSANNSPTELASRLSGLKETAGEYLEKIDEALYLAMKKKEIEVNGRTKKILEVSFKESDWESHVRGALPPLPEQMRGYLEEASRDAARFYHDYALAFLTRLKLGNREKGGRDQ